MAALKSDDRRAALQSIIGSKGWFARFKSTEISKAMLNESESGVATAILARATQFAPADVLTLVEKNWSNSKESDGRIWHVLQEFPAWTEQHLGLAAGVIGRTDIAPFAFDHMLSTVGATQPVFAIRLALARLQTILQAAKEQANGRAINKDAATEDEVSSIARYMDSPAEPLKRLVEQSDGWDGLEALGKTDPSSFLSILWPWFHDVMEAIAAFKEDTGNEFSFPLPYGPDFRFDDEGTLDLPEPSLLGAFRTAAESLAALDSEKFLDWVHTAENSANVPAQRLVAHAFGSQPERYAAEFLKFLISDKRRFNLGSVEDMAGTTKRSVQAISPFWTVEQIEEFIQAVKSYSPQPEQDRDAKSRQYFYRLIEQTRFELLSKLPADRLPADAQTIVNEGTRKFGEAKRGATFSGVQWIGSPMSADAIGRASDEDVINAFGALPDATGWDNPKRWMKGGNVQLSRAFADFSKQNSDKAIQIIGRFTPEIGTRAAGYAIDAMAEKESAALLLPVIHDLDGRGFVGEEYRGSVARAIEKLINRDFEIDDKTLEMLRHWLASPDEITEPSKEKTADLTSDDDLDNKDENEQAESILWGMGGLSILPHGNFPILETVTRILLERKDYAQLITILTNHLDKTDDQKVWAALMRLFPYIHGENGQLTKFYRALFDKYPGLTHNRETAILLAHIHWILPELVRELLGQWQGSEHKFVQQLFGELGTLVWLMQPKLDWPSTFINAILTTEAAAPARTGATFAAIHVWAETDNKERAADLLQKLIKNSSDDTWKAAIDIFRLVDDITPDDDWVKILQAISEEIPNHKTFNSTFIIDRLQSLLPHESSLVASIAKALVAKWEAELGDLRTGTAAIAPELVDIAITLHRLGSDTREPGLEIFESLLSINAYTARETLDQVDNRFRTSQPAARMSLPRRQRRNRVRKRKVA